MDLMLHGLPFLLVFKWSILYTDKKNNKEKDKYVKEKFDNNDYIEVDEDDGVVIIYPPPYDLDKTIIKIFD